MLHIFWLSWQLLTSAEIVLSAGDSMVLRSCSFSRSHTKMEDVTRCILLDDEREQVPVLEQPIACKIKSLNWIENYQVTRLLLPIDHNIATSSSMTLNWWESSYKFLSSPLIKVFPYTDISITCNMKLDNPVVEIQKEILRKERHTWGS